MKVDLSEAREGKLSEFFEPEIEYIWLKENANEGLLGRGVLQVFFHDEKIYVVDTQGCKCIQIFDKTGKYLNEINGYGEGPGQYLQFYTAIFKENELMLLGVPKKLMWFDLEGEFLREQHVNQQIGAAAYSDSEKRYYFYTKASENGDFFFESVNEAFQDTVRSIPFDENSFYGYYRGASTLQKQGEKIFFGMPLQDTIYEANESHLTARYVWDFGKYGQDVQEMQKYDVEVNGMEYIKFQNSEAKMYFEESWFILEKLLISSFRHEGASYVMLYDIETQQTNLIKKLLVNDLDEFYTYANIHLQFTDGKVGTSVPGKTLFNLLQKKKEALGQEGFEEYVKGKGKSFAQAAFAAKDSENPALIVYTVKK
ncbi:6-bladed beta-propeller [Algoriphagus persicinus]|uniref:6-bladed beta-propeller n=1 Tax=Algoriphagus persicinus TaxID=3108754 RepID=UPI002B3CE341|nr:6-bladed beta-propeller [Algoriphagus sp. E1-3-M2]MEB2786425.1 6-bladed beta-propeller [Algoriphagus sp. E1-3-M2]